MSLLAKVEAHAAACREAVATGRERPLWAGGSLAMVNLSGANLAGANLSGANLFGTALSGADLIGADLRGADLRYVNLFGTNLTGADLRGANLTGADLFRATISGADLTGARLSVGVARGCAMGGIAGGYHWLAVKLEDGDVDLQFGCERHPLTWWLAQGPDLCVRYGHPPEFWEEGPAVAIVAAVELGQSLPPGVRR